MHDSAGVPEIGESMKTLHFVISCAVFAMAATLLGQQLVNQAEVKIVNNTRCHNPGNVRWQWPGLCAIADLVRRQLYNLC